MLYLGSTPGGVDVREITSVGNLQMITVNELVLHDGATYYVTITGKFLTLLLC